MVVGAGGKGWATADVYNIGQVYVVYNKGGVEHGRGVRHAQGVLSKAFCANCL